MMGTVCVLIIVKEIYLTEIWFKNNLKKQQRDHYRSPDYN